MFLGTFLVYYRSMEIKGLKKPKLFAQFERDDKVLFGQKLYKWRNLTKTDVRQYFNILKRSKFGGIRMSGEFCERCGISIGEKFLNEKSKDWNGWALCLECYLNKTEGKPENTPDLEDLIRFGLLK